MTQFSLSPQTLSVSQEHQSKTEIISVSGDLSRNVDFSNSRCGDLYQIGASLFRMYPCASNQAFAHFDTQKIVFYAKFQGRFTCVLETFTYGFSRFLEFSKVQYSVQCRIFKKRSLFSLRLSEYPFKFIIFSKYDFYTQQIIKIPCQTCSGWCCHLFEEETTIQAKAIKFTCLQQSYCYLCLIRNVISYYISFKIINPAIRAD